jgi:hypothetical protein
MGGLPQLLELPFAKYILHRCFLACPVIVDNASREVVRPHNRVIVDRNITPLLAL